MERSLENFFFKFFAKNKGFFLNSNSTKHEVSSNTKGVPLCTSYNLSDSKIRFS